MILAGEIWRIATPGRGSADSLAARQVDHLRRDAVLGFPVAVLVRAAAVIVGGIAQRHTPYRVAFNAAQLSLSLGAAELVMLGLWRQPDDASIPGARMATAPGLVIFAAVAYFIVNYLLVAFAVSLRTRSPIRSVGGGQPALPGRCLGRAVRDRSADHDRDGDETSR